MLKKNQSRLIVAANKQHVVVTNSALKKKMEVGGHFLNEQPMDKRGNECFGKYPLHGSCLQVVDCKL